MKTIWRAQGGSLCCGPDRKGIPGKEAAIEKEMQTLSIDMDIGRADPGAAGYPQS